MFARRMAVCALATALAAGCADGPSATVAPPAPDAAVPDTAFAVPHCRPPAGTTGNPATVAQAVALTNALPRPVTLTCFLESLDRPLRMDAVNSIISLQPAAGRQNPRLFLASGGGKLILSVVSAGAGSALVEFGEFVDSERTVKAEIEFPVEEPLDGAAPYRRIRRVNQVTGNASTTCAGCHRAEEEADSLGFPEAFLSAAVRPVPRDRVSVDEVRAQHRSCDGYATPARCAFFRALFDHGPVLQWEFPAHLPTIFY